MTPVEPFDELIAELRREGFSSAAESISALRYAAWTTRIKLP